MQGPDHRPICRPKQRISVLSQIGRRPLKGLKGNVLIQCICLQEQFGRCAMILCFVFSSFESEESRKLTV